MHYGTGTKTAAQENGQGVELRVKRPRYWWIL